MASDHGTHSGKKRKRKDSGDRDNHHDYPEVALDRLQMNTLRRYKRYYKLQTRQGLTKALLCESVSKHFQSMTFDPNETVAYFIYMVKCNRNRLDNKDAISMNSNHNNSNSSNRSNDNSVQENHAKK